ncbi:MAG: ABC transporter substrate-binding protein [Spirochaetales bacterium]|nr:ABC transporter substrate-binding protein [Spirochaetales bacterium]
MIKSKLPKAFLLCVFTLSIFIVPSLFAAGTQEDSSGNPYAGKELSILVSAGWMDSRYDETIARFEETFNVSVDLQTVPADQYGDILQTRLLTGECADVFWIQSNPFAIESVIVDYEDFCIDFSGSAWESVVPEARLLSCKVGDSLYGLQLWHNSPEYVMVYNKSMFTEMGLEIPTTYAELKDVSAALYAQGITPWFIPGADGWQHQLAFFQIGGIYEANHPGLYEGLNNNTATFKDNQTMLKVLSQMKELSDLGYLGEDWIGSNSTNMANMFGDRKIAMAMANSSYIQQIKDETGTTDEFGLFLLPLADNSFFPTNPAGPTMFGFKGTENEDLVRLFFDFVCETESLQEILDNSPAYTNIHVNDDAVQQHWLAEEKAFVDSITPDQMVTPVLQTGTKYTNDYWMDFGADMMSYFIGRIDANDVLGRMDANRAKSAKIAQDPAW